MKKITLFTLAVLSIISAFAQIQQDADGCKDHPMFNRLPNFYINQCAENFASLDLITGADNKTEYQEGTRTHIDYLFNPEDNHKYPSWLQVTRNYETAILKLGGKKIFGDNSYATYKVAKDGRETWIMLTFNSGTDLQVEQYVLDILEKEPMKQEISANDIYSALKTEGHIALYINFESGKSEIKPESQNIIDQIAEMLKSNPSLKTSIEGHTDNVGTAASNQTLSENRAKAVMTALVSKGIDKTRFSAKGWGQTKPISDNSTDDGKAKNRRVEIVKM